jgi:hypothetical protein
MGTGLEIASLSTRVNMGQLRISRLDSAKFCYYDSDPPRVASNDVADDLESWRSSAKILAANRHPVGHICRVI